MKTPLGARLPKLTLQRSCTLRKTKVVPEPEVRWAPHQACAAASPNWAAVLDGSSFPPL